MTHESYLINENDRKLICLYVEISLSKFPQSFWSWGSEFFNCCTKMLKEICDINGMANLRLRPPRQSL